MARTKQPREGYVVNPDTGRYVKIGSATYKKLLKNQKFKDMLGVENLKPIGREDFLKAKALSPKKKPSPKKSSPKKKVPAHQKKQKHINMNNEISYRELVEMYAITDAFIIRYEVKDYANDEFWKRKGNTQTLIRMTPKEIRDMLLKAGAENLVIALKNDGGLNEAYDDRLRIGIYDASTDKSNLYESILDYDKHTFDSGELSVDERLFFLNVMDYEEFRRTDLNVLYENLPHLGK